MQKVPECPHCSTRVFVVLDGEWLVGWFCPTCNKMMYAEREVPKKG